MIGHIRNNICSKVRGVLRAHNKTMENLGSQSGLVSSKIEDEFCGKMIEVMIEEAEGIAKLKAVREKNQPSAETIKHSENFIRRLKRRSERMGR